MRTDNYILLDLICLIVSCFSGGPGQKGEVIAIVNFSLDTDRDAAEVTWGNDHTNVYRLGFEGSVDLKLESPGSAKYYYRLHLPELSRFLLDIVKHFFSFHGHPSTHKTCTFIGGLIYHIQIFVIF